MNGNMPFEDYSIEHNIHCSDSPPNLNNNAPNKNKTKNSKAIPKKRKAPARSQLVARSMRDGNEERPITKTLPKTWQDTKKKSSPKISPILKPKQQKKKQIQSQQGNPPTIATASSMNRACDKRERKSQQKRDKMLETLANMDTSPTHNCMITKKCKNKCCAKSCQKCKIKSSRQPNQKTPTGVAPTKRLSFNDKDWPSLEPQHRKGVIKDAATELVKNKQGGTIAQLSRQKKAGIAATVSPKNKELTTKNRQEGNIEAKKCEQKTWSVATMSPKNKELNMKNRQEVNIESKKNEQKTWSVANVFPKNEEITTKNRPDGNIGSKKSAQKSWAAATACRNNKELTTKNKQEGNIESRNSVENQCKPKTWASVVGSCNTGGGTSSNVWSNIQSTSQAGALTTEIPSTSKPCRLSPNSINKSIKVCGQTSKENILSTPASRKQTIEKRRVSQKQRAKVNVTEDDERLIFTTKKSTTTGQEHGMMWNIDHMPESLRFTRPASGTINLDDYEKSEACERNKNKCNNRQSNFPSLLAVQGYTNVSNAFSTEERSEVDICQMMDGVSFDGNTSENDQGQLDQKQKKPRKKTKKPRCIQKTKQHITENNPDVLNPLLSTVIEPPKKVSNRYRAMMRRDASRLGAKELSEQICRDKLEEATNERKSERILNAKKKRLETQQRLRNDTKDVMDNGSVVVPDVNADQGTSSQFVYTQTSVKVTPDPTSCQSAHAQVSVKVTTDPTSCQSAHAQVSVKVTPDPTSAPQPLQTSEGATMDVDENNDGF